MFWDEFGFSFQESLAATWARRGKRPVFRRVTKERRALSTAVALTLSGKIILIWDRARIHRSKITKVYLQNHPEIRMEELPAYAPELNPEEYCHGNVKQGLKNARPACQQEMCSMLDRGFARLRRRPDLLLSFFHAAGLSVRKLRLT